MEKEKIIHNEAPMTTRRKATAWTKRLCDDQCEESGRDGYI